MRIILFDEGFWFLPTQPPQIALLPTSVLSIAVFRIRQRRRTRFNIILAIRWHKAGRMAGSSTQLNQLTPTEHMMKMSHSTPSSSTCLNCSLFFLCLQLGYLQSYMYLLYFAFWKPGSCMLVVTSDWSHSMPYSRNFSLMASTLNKLCLS